VRKPDVTHRPIAQMTSSVVTTEMTTIRLPRPRCVAIGPGMYHSAASSAESAEPYQGTASGSRGAEGSAAKSQRRELFVAQRLGHGRIKRTRATTTASMLTSGRLTSSHLRSTDRKIP